MNNGVTLQVRRPNVEGEPGAVGRDFGKHLPGLFWWNYFGAPYRTLLGEERLRSSPGQQVATVGDGVVVQLNEDPGEWDTAEYAAMEQ